MPPAGFEPAISASEQPLGLVFLALVDPKYSLGFRFWGSYEAHKFSLWVK